VTRSSLRRRPLPDLRWRMVPGNRALSCRARFEAAVWHVYRKKEKRGRRCPCGWSFIALSQKRPSTVTLS